MTTPMLPATSYSSKATWSEVAAKRCGRGLQQFAEERRGVCDIVPCWQPLRLWDVVLDDKAGARCTVERATAPCFGTRRLSSGEQAPETSPRPAGANVHRSGTTFVSGSWHSPVFTAHQQTPSSAAC